MHKNTPCRGTNIVLIGMPGCGKTTVGRAVAALGGRPFIDIDEVIIARVGMDIPAFFASRGEVAFRAVERKAVMEAAKREGCVIATGGGSVLDARNRADLQACGRVFFLRRPLALLAVEGRPLSLRLEEMARVRVPLYEAVCDETVDNTGSIEDAARQVWDIFLRA